MYGNVSGILCEVKYLILVTLMTLCLCHTSKQQGVG